MSVLGRAERTRQVNKRKAKEEMIETATVEMAIKANAEGEMREGVGKEAAVDAAREEGVMIEEVKAGEETTKERVDTLARSKSIRTRKTLGQQTVIRNLDQQLASPRTSGAKRESLRTARGMTIPDLRQEVVAGDEAEALEMISRELMTKLKILITQPKSLI